VLGTKHISTNKGEGREKILVTERIGRTGSPAERSMHGPGGEREQIRCFGPEGKENPRGGEDTTPKIMSVGLSLRGGKGEAAIQRKKKNLPTKGEDNSNIWFERQMGALGKKGQGRHTPIPKLKKKGVVTAPPAAARKPAVLSEGQLFPSV